MNSNSELTCGLAADQAAPSRLELFFPKCQTLTQFLQGTVIDTW
jgi:hypothetical protein